MNGEGSMKNQDGTSYTGSYQDNMMHGHGTYVDLNKVMWSGIFINGRFDSRIQRRLAVEKEIEDKVSAYETKAKSFFVQFAEAFARSDKKTFKDNLAPFFATADLCSEFISEPYVKYEERTPDKWNELIKSVYQDGNVALRVLKKKEDATALKPESVLAEQLKSKRRGGQIVELSATVADKPIQLALCETASESWVLVFCA